MGNGWAKNETDSEPRIWDEKKLERGAPWRPRRAVRRGGGQPALGAYRAPPLRWVVSHAVPRCSWYALIGVNRGAPARAKPPNRNPNLWGCETYLGAVRLDRNPVESGRLGRLWVRQINGRGQCRWLERARRRKTGKA